jgi:hypothetical protein
MSANFSPASGGVPSGVQPISPGKKSSGLLKGCLIIAGILAIIFVLVLAVGGWLAYSKGGKLIATAMETAKPEFLGYMSEDHAPEERAEMEQAYDDMVRQMKDEGMIQLFTRHEKSFRIFQAITADDKVTPDESRLWLEEWNRENSPAAPENQNPE